MTSDAETIKSGSREALRLFLRTALPPRIRTFSEWLQRELIVPAGPYKGQRINFTRQPWVRLFAAEIDSGRWRRTVTTGPVQSGKSLVCFVAPMLYHLFEIGEKVICGVPNLDMVDVKWSEDIRPSIDNGRYSRNVMPGGKGSRGGTPTRIDFLNGAALQFMCAGGNDKQRAGATTRVMCITETDGMDDVGSTSDEGTKIDQLLGRLRAYGDRAVAYMECSVTNTDGFIWSEYQAGSAAKIACPCPHCDEFITPEREDLLGWQDADNAIEAGKQSTFVCSECGGFISESDRRAMNELAVLVHRGQSVEGGKVIGDYPQTDTLGFRWSAFNNLFATTEQLGREEWKAAQAENQDLTQLTRKQQVWCIPAEVDSEEKSDLTAGIARGSANGYAGRCNGIARGVWPEDTVHRVGTIDIHKRNLRWQVSSKRANGQVHIVDYGSFETESPDIVGDEVAIHDAIKKLCPMLHTTHAIKVGLVDCGNWTETVQEAVRQSGPPWICSHGAPNYKMPEKTTANKVRNNHADHWHLTRPGGGVYVITMDPDYFKHVVHSTLLVKPINTEGQSVPGCVTLFGTDTKEHMAWASEIVAETFERTFKIGKGFSEAWVKHSKMNHSLDLTYGTLCAISVAEAANAEATEETPTKPDDGAFVRSTSSGWMKRGKR